MKYKVWDKIRIIDKHNWHCHDIWDELYIISIDDWTPRYWISWTKWWERIIWWYVADYEIELVEDAEEPILPTHTWIQYTWFKSEEHYINILNYLEEYTSLKWISWNNIRGNDLSNYEEHKEFHLTNDEDWIWWCIWKYKDLEVIDISNILLPDKDILQSTKDSIEDTNTKFKLWEIVMLISRASTSKHPYWTIWTIEKIDKSDWTILFKWEDIYLEQSTYWYRMEQISKVNIADWITWDAECPHISVSELDHLTVDIDNNWTILKYNINKTMSTFDKIQTEAFFSDKKNVKAIEEMKSNLSIYPKMFDKARSDLYTMEIKSETLRDDFNRALANDDYKQIEKLLKDNKDLVEYLERYS